MLKHRSLFAGAFLLALIVLAVFMPFPGSVQAASFTVNSAGDQPDSFLADGFCDTAHRPDLDPPIPPSGICTLRAAIMQANAQPDPDTISFSIGGGGAQSIAPFSRLPDLTNPVIIDGTTQPGFAGQPVIELNGSNVPFAVVGLSIASDSTVKGLAITGFGEAGLRVGSNNIITGNYIGIDATGTVASGNGRDQVGLGGIVALGANNRIGGTDHDPGVCNRECNLISANGNAGVLIDGGFGRNASGNRVLGNFFGTEITGAVTDPDGTPGTGDELGNTVGVAIVGPGATGNLVGGTTPEARNLVAGSQFNHIRILGGPSDNTVQGNLLGTDVTGTQPLGAGFSAVFIFNASNNVIGGAEDNPAEGACPGVCNLIAASGVHGVLIEGTPFAGATGNRVQGNYIGTNVNGGCQLDSEGLCPLGNRGDGVRVRNASDNLIGGAGQGHGNLISGNRGDGVNGDGAHGPEEIEGDGVHVEGANARQNRLQGNFIGATLRGDGPLGNAGSGVVIAGASSNVVGGNITGESNVISANTGDGVRITGANAQDNLVQGNFIGVSAIGDNPLPNGDVAVEVAEGARDTTVGGTEAGQGNRIYGGVFVLGDTTQGASVLGNEVTMPGARSIGDALPIDLSGDGPSCNPWVNGTGPNGGVAPPRILRLATTVVEGRTSPEATVEAYRVRFPGIARGRYFPRWAVPVGHATADAEGNFSIPVDLPVGTSVAVTATDTEGNTSELSQLQRPLILLPGIGGTWLDADRDDTELWLPDGTTDETQNANLGRMALNEAGDSLEPVSANRIIETHPVILGIESVLVYGFTTIGVTHLDTWQR